MLNSKIKFLNFLESIKTKENSPLLESVIKGFTILTESSETPILKEVTGKYNGVLVDIDVSIIDVETEGYPAEHGGMDSPSWSAGHDIVGYKALATLQPLDEGSYEPNGEPVSVPETEFSKIQIVHLQFSDNKVNEHAKPDGSTTLEKVVDDYLEANVDKWAPDNRDDSDFDRDDY